MAPVGDLKGLATQDPSQVDTQVLPQLADSHASAFYLHVAHCSTLVGTPSGSFTYRDQDRITEQEDKAKTELAETEADLDKWQEVLSVAIRLAGSCHAAYLKANPKVRRRFNDAVLKAVYVEDGKIKRAEFTDVFAALFSRPSSNKWIKVAPAGTERKGRTPVVLISASYEIELGRSGSVDSRS